MSENNKTRSFQKSRLKTSSLNPISTRGWIAPQCQFFPNKSVNNGVMMLKLRDC